MSQTWEWAREQYASTDLGGQAIADAIGVPLYMLYSRMHRAGVHRRRKPREARGRGRPIPAGFDAEVRRRQRNKTIERIGGEPTAFRCQDCFAKSSSPVCVCGAIINSYLSGAA